MARHHFGSHTINVLSFFLNHLLLYILESCLLGHGVLSRYTTVSESNLLNLSKGDYTRDDS